MARKTIPLLFSNNRKLTAKKAGCQRLVNFYLEERTDALTGSTKLSAYKTPGFKEWLDLNGTNTRSGIVQHNYLYAVRNDKLYKIDTNAVEVEVGTINTTAGICWMTALNDEIVISDETNVWSYIISTNNFAEITDPDLLGFGTVGCVITLANRVIFCIKDTDTFVASELEDGRNVLATTFASAELRYDNTLSALANNNNIYFFGDITTEIWSAVDDVVVPYDRVQGGLLEVGIAAKASAITVKNSIYALAKDKTGIIGVIRLNGINLEIISEPWLVELVNKYINIQTAYAWSHENKGHHFYNLTFLSDETGVRGVTWSYNTSNGSWNELESYNENNSFSLFKDRHLAAWAVKFGTKQLIGDSRSGKLYELSSNYFKEGNNSISRLIRGPNLNYNNQPMCLTNIQLNMEGGIATEEVTNPQVSLSYSTDGSNTFSTPRYVSTGGMGQYLNNFYWSGAGTAKDFCFQIECSDAVDWAFHDLTAQFYSSHRG